MQRGLFNSMFGSSLYSFSYAGPLRGGHDAEVAHGENELRDSEKDVSTVFIMFLLNESLSTLSLLGCWTALWVFYVIHFLLSNYPGTFLNVS